MKKIYNLLIIILIIGFDQAIKFLATNTLQSGKTMPLIGQWVKLNVLTNSGAAFSIRT